MRLFIDDPLRWRTQYFTVSNDFYVYTTPVAVCSEMSVDLSLLSNKIAEQFPSPPADRLYNLWIYEARSYSLTRRSAWSIIRRYEW